jgi:hypothetical protein
MKNLTLAEAAAIVAQNMPREDLHEGRQVGKDMKKVVSFLEGFLKMKADETHKSSDLLDAIDISLENISHLESLSKPFNYKQSIERAAWVILHEAVGIIAWNRAPDVNKEVKSNLSKFNKLMKL